MASTIDPLVPANFVPADKATLRANFLAAKNEIEALQSGTLPLAGGTMIGAIVMGGNQITGAKAPLAPTEITASRTLALADADQKMFYCNHATVAIAITVPSNATAAFPVGTLLSFTRWGAAAVSFAAAGGVTLNKPSDKALTVRAQYEVASLWKQATDVWLLFGGLT